MKIPLYWIIVISFRLTFAAYASKYNDLTEQGYRWALVDGPYACTTEEYLERINGRRTDAAELQVIEEGQCYYLIPGTIVQVLKEDASRHMTLIRMGSVTRSLWTYRRFLSKHPIRDAYGTIQMPADVGLIWPSNPAFIQRISSDSSTVGTPSNRNP